MELTININVSERLCEAIEILAAAISVTGKQSAPVVKNEEVPVVPVVAEPEGVDHSGAALEKLKRELDLVEVKVEPVTITADMLRDKMQAILQKNPDRALDVKGSLLNLGAERISDLDQVRYAEFYAELTTIEKEVAA